MHWQVCNDFLTLTVKGIPNLDSPPKPPSGNEAPISEIAILAEDIPVINPTQP